MATLEAIIALAIGLGVIVGALEASRMAMSRAALAALEMEAAIKAESLLSKVGTDFPLESGHSEGSDGAGTRWTLDIGPYLPAAKGLSAFDVAVRVTIRSGGLSAREEIATLKLRPERSP